MNSRYLQLLDRVLEGDDLNERDARMLSRALEDEATRTGAADWVDFHNLLREKLEGDTDARRETSKERLRAKVALNEKRREHHHAAAARRHAWWPWGALAAAAVLVALGGWHFFGAEDTPYPAAKAEGDFTVFRDDQAIEDESLKRGDRIIAGAEGARVNLGGYCDLTLDPAAKVVLRGEDGREAIALETGTVFSKIMPKRGGFVVQTPIGSVTVIGTEFATSVPRDDPEALAGEEPLSGALSGVSKREAEAFIRQFSAPRFDVRQKAVEGLVKMGPAVLPLVRKTLAETNDNEVKLRCEMVIKSLGSEPQAATPQGKPAAPSVPPVMVEVSVLSGVVAFRFGDETGQLAAGESRRFPAPQAPVEETQPVEKPVEEEEEEPAAAGVVPEVDEAEMTADQLFKRAWDSNDHNEKVRLYTRVIELDPKRAAAWQNRGFSYAILREFALALADYNKCLELDPNNAYAYNNRGQLLLNRDQLNEALNDLNKAVELLPTLPYPYNHLGRLYVRQGKYDLAVENFSKSIERLGDGDNRWLLVHLNRAKANYRLKQYDKAWADVKYCREKKIKVPDDFLHDLEDASGKFEGE